MKDPSGTYWYHNDHLGSVRLMTEESGTVVATSDFLPFGERFATSGADGANPYDFAGHRTDPESGLVYMHARYYDPVIGRFISPDRVVPDILNPQSLNPYSYVYNNPISNVDPTGHMPVGAIGLALYAAAQSLFTGTLLSYAASATLSPYSLTLGTVVGILLGFVGGYGMAVGGFGLGSGAGIVGGLAGGSAAWLSSANSPLSGSARQIVGWAWSAIGLIVLAKTLHTYAMAVEQQQVADASADAGQTPGAAFRESQGVEVTTYNFDIADEPFGATHAVHTVQDPDGGLFYLEGLSANPPADTNSMGRVMAGLGAGSGSGSMGPLEVHIGTAPNAAALPRTGDLVAMQRWQSGLTFAEFKAAAYAFQGAVARGNYSYNTFGLFGPNSNSLAYYFPRYIGYSGLRLVTFAPGAGRCVVACN
jgi:RHS repeat-associated protein